MAICANEIKGINLSQHIKTNDNKIAGTKQFEYDVLPDEIPGQGSARAGSPSATKGAPSLALHPRPTHRKGVVSSSTLSLG